MIIEFEGIIFHWRGPAPYFFIAIPAEASANIKAIASQVSYGWGVIPVRAQIGRTQWTTSLFPKDGLYLVPVRKNVQQAESLGVGDKVALRVEIG